MASVAIDPKETPQAANYCIARHSSVGLLARETLVRSGRHGARRFH
jgi:hypothetical protein